MRIGHLDTLVQEIHASNAQLAIALTGGGTLAISSLLSAPGGSRTVLECVVPYSALALAEYLGRAPEQYCSDATARAMAMVAFFRAERLGGDWRRRIGVGCSASLATDRPKRGEHRLHVACQTGAATAVASIVLQKGRRSRAEEERLAAALLLNQIAEAAGLSDRLPLELLDGESVDSARHDASPLWQELWSGRSGRISVRAAGPEQPAVVFPGAFDPLHYGHLRMAEVGARILGAAPAWELSIENVDKPPLDYLEVGRRLARFDPGANVWLTRAPTFAIKAELFPGATFLVGADTILRIDDPRYYGHSPAERDAAIQAIAGRGCRFLVFGRVLGGPECPTAPEAESAPETEAESAADTEAIIAAESEAGSAASREAGSAAPSAIAEPDAADFHTLSQLDLSPGLRALCQEAPAEAFREDVSSTALRRTELDDSDS